MQLTVTLRDVARIGAVVVLGVWFAFYRPVGVFGGSAGYVMVEGRSMLPTYRSGDLVVALPSATYRPGDVVIFTVPAGQPGAGGRVIHRIVREEGGAFVTRGDNNGWDDSWRPTPADILGSPVTTVPGAGRVVGLVRSPMVAGLAAAFIAFVLLEPLIGGGGRRKQRSPEVADAAAGG